MANYSLFISETILPRLRREFTREEVREIGRIFGLIQADPTPDRRFKFIVPRPPAILTVYATPQFWVWYHVRSQLVVVDNVERAHGYIPMPW